MRALFCFLIFALPFTLGSTAADAARTPPPVGNHDALYKWCRTAVFDQSGKAAPQPGKPKRRVMKSRVVIAMTDQCVRAGGQGY